MAQYKVTARMIDGKKLRGVNLPDVNYDFLPWGAETPSLHRQSDGTEREPDTVADGKPDQQPRGQSPGQCWYQVLRAERLRRVLRLREEQGCLLPD